MTRLSRGRTTTRFLADGMLGSFARKLRILGFDTSYQRSGTDTDLADMASNERRVVLTCDRQLWSHLNSRDIPAMLIEGKNDRERLAGMLQAAQSSSLRLDVGESRCALCNGILHVVEKEKLKDRLPQGILTRHRFFSACHDCDKVYWKGKHWSRLRRYSAALGPQKRFNH